MKLKILILSCLLTLTGWAVTLPPIILGSGSPESATTAPIGSVFRRLDGGAGTTFYLKESGTGNTGWKAALTASQVAIVSGKLMTVNNTLTFAGTDGTTMTFPSTSATLARTDAANTFTGHQTFEGVTATGAIGTGNMVFSISPTFTGTTSVAALNVSGLAAFSGLMTQSFTSGAANPVGFYLNPTFTNGAGSFAIGLGVSPTATQNNASAFVFGMQIGANLTAGSVTGGFGGIYVNPINGSGSTVPIGYGILINNVSGSTLNYALYTGTGIVRLGDATDASTAGAGALTSIGGGYFAKGIIAGTFIRSISPTSGIGYSTGAGGTVTQTTSRSTGVTLSKVSGAITTDTTSLAAGASASFTVTNTAVAATDVIVLSIKSGQTNKETKATVSAVASGSFEITVHNSHASTAETGAIVINFVVIKGVTS